MGQTLTNGIYLPAEGERNCYDGLEGNWRSLDGLISTVSGKASATHTHGNITNDGKVGTTANVPLITGTGGVVQAGSFGNQANTFCEGNDSRLSDARTPVAHTHTKSDVTDLLNSNFIPSANNSYDLGSSSYQWNNLYAKRVNTQSINGINPGALSLPGYDWDPLDTQGIALDGSYSYKTMSDNGWLYVNLRDTTCQTDGEVTIFNGSTALYGQNFVCSSDQYVRMLIPVYEGCRVRFRINPNGGNPTSLVLKLYVPIGNV